MFVFGPVNNYMSIFRPVNNFLSLFLALLTVQDHQPTSAEGVHKKSVMDRTCMKHK